MATVKKIKIIFDTNWYISVSINRRSRRVFYQNIIKSNRFDIFYSDELLTEYQSVIQRKKFEKYINSSQIRRFLTFFLPKLKKTKTLSFTGLRDEKDNFLIGMCKSCHPYFLITGDEDLLILGTFENTTILTMSQFLQILPLII